MVLENRIDGPATVDVAILDGAESVFSTEVALPASGERTVADFDLAGGEYTLRVVRGRTRAETPWEVTAPDGQTACSPSCSAFAFVRPAEVELTFVTLH